MCDVPRIYRHPATGQEGRVRPILTFPGVFLHKFKPSDSMAASRSRRTKNDEAACVSADMGEATHMVCSASRGVTDRKRKQERSMLNACHDQQLSPQRTRRSQLPRLEGVLFCTGAPRRHAGRPRGTVCSVSSGRRNQHETSMFRESGGWMLTKHEIWIPMYSKLVRNALKSRRGDNTQACTNVARMHVGTTC